ncbi:TIGR04222 domain-containing membrane protein [Streptomyces lavendofoliae]|uniref:TIGR04222 domain-containing membrane protein n=1 Tax=Streptomyces lavendofoliae TaxID=67314 RepID=UPI003D8B1AE5
MWRDWFYAAAAALWLVALVNLLVAGLRLVNADESRGHLKRDLSLLELAYVAGGPGRVAATVLARMKHEGQLTLGIDGTAWVPVETAGVVDEVERAALEVANVPGRRKLAYVAARTADSWPVRKIGYRLEAEGLVIPRSVLRRYRWTWRVVWGPPSCLCL